MGISGRPLFRETGSKRSPAPVDVCRPAPSPQVGDYMFAKLAPYDFAYLGQGVFQARAGRGGGFTPEGFR